MREEKQTETWETQRAPLNELRFVRNGRGSEIHKIRHPECRWGSDQSIVLGGRESRLHGEGCWQTYAVRKGNIGRTSRTGRTNANLTVGNSREGKPVAASQRQLAIRMPSTEASTSEEPGAGKLHAGICAGAVG
jgi:hypothetical protein